MKAVLNIKLLFKIKNFESFEYLKNYFLIIF